MKDPFAKKNDKGIKSRKSIMTTGTFEDMLKGRAKNLPEYEDSITKMLKDYNGEQLAIVIQREDENGRPSNTEFLSVGMSSMESTIQLAEGLQKAARSVLEETRDSVDGDLDAMLKLAELMINKITKDLRK